MINEIKKESNWYPMFKENVVYKQQLMSQSELQIFAILAASEYKYNL